MHVYVCACARVHVCMHACGHVCPHPPLFVLHFFFNVHIIHVYIYNLLAHLVLYQ